MLGISKPNPTALTNVDLSIFLSELSFLSMYTGPQPYLALLTTANMYSFPCKAKKMQLQVISNFMDLLWIRKR